MDTAARNLWSNFPLIFLCSKEGLQLHSCVLVCDVQGQHSKSKTKCQLKPGPGWLEKKLLQREACTMSRFAGGAGVELYRKGMLTQTKSGTLFCDHTSFCHCHHHTEGRHSETGISKPRDWATLNPIFRAGTPSCEIIHFFSSIPLNYFILIVWGAGSGGTWPSG